MLSRVHNKEESVQLQHSLSKMSPLSSQQGVKLLTRGTCSLVAKKIPLVVLAPACT